METGSPRSQRATLTQENTQIHTRAAHHSPAPRFLSVKSSSATSQRIPVQGSSVGPPYLQSSVIRWCPGSSSGVFGDISHWLADICPKNLNYKQVEVCRSSLRMSSEWQISSCPTKPASSTSLSVTSSQEAATRGSWFDTGMLEAASRRWCWWRRPDSASSTSPLCRGLWCLTLACLCCPSAGRPTPRSSSLRWSTGRGGRTPSGGGAPAGCWTVWSRLWFSRSPGWARSKLWSSCDTSPASSSSATPLLPSWSPSWARPALSRSTASSTNRLPGPERLSLDHSDQKQASVLQPQ